MIRIDSSQKPIGLETLTKLNPINNNDDSANVALLQPAKNDEGLVFDYKKNLETAVESLNKTIEIIDRGLEFSIHEGTNRVMVKVIERGNEDKVIREIPPEKLLDLLAEIKKILGLLIDCRV